ncbi:MAG TPA: hypothetical protein VGR90_10025, partial [Acidimicrobiales bacterium]|nr:hypothetical protein [Acidimicrobiales bacterium]
LESGPAPAGSPSNLSTVTVSVDTNWLAKVPSSQFPVDVDPTINVGAPLSEAAYKGDDSNPNMAVERHPG